MEREDFSLWLSAISGMSAAQRAEGSAALEKGCGRRRAFNENEAQAN